MQRNFGAYLWDMQDAGRAILEFTAGKSAEDFASSLLVRSAVERQFSIIGEALAQAKHHFPEQVSQIADVSRIIAFRSQLIHNYHDTDPHRMWQIITDDLPPLMSQVQALLGPDVEQ
jgi:uncharacterized protein with HEPN domain